MGNNRPLVIFDIDGTIADHKHRMHHIKFNASINGFLRDFKKNYTKFYAEAHRDEPIEANIKLMHILHMFCDIKFFTSRRLEARKATLKWIDDNCQLVGYTLHMRPEGDHRPDYFVKEEMYNALSKEDKGRLLCVYEDRDQCVDMYRALGITCHQVCDGNY